MTSGFLNIAKNVLRKAVGLGVEEAGVRVCGKTGWNAIKTVVSPVIEELERRYPGLMLMPEKMEQAEQDLNTDTTLEDIVQERLGAIETGQKEILTVLFRNEETLSSYRTLFFNAFAEANKRAEERHKILLNELHKFKTDVGDDIRAIGKKPPVIVEPRPTLYGLLEQSSGYQSDAMTWLTAGQPFAAAERLTIARTLAMGGLVKMGQSTELLSMMGYIEKTQAQVCFAENNIDEATHHLADAARYFNEALKLKPEDLSSLNGIANIYQFGGDYDAAIEIGRTIKSVNASYGAAVWDLGLALEKKLQTFETMDNQAMPLLNEAIEVDESLLKIMPQQPSSFRSSDLNYVQNRLASYKNRDSSACSSENNVEAVLLQSIQQAAFQKIQEFATLYGEDNFESALNFTRQSLEYLDLSLSRFPNDLYLMNVKGYCFINESMALSSLGHHDQAKKSLDAADKIFQEILCIDPDEAMALHGKGNVEMRSENWQAALQYIDHALKVAPNYPAAKYDREIILKKLTALST